MKSKYVKKHECVIIGGGAAGMMAAVQLAGYGIDNCIIEHTGKIGSKILQTGNGKCNFTNLNMSSEMYQNKDNRLVMEVIDKFDVQHTLKFFKSIGVYYTQKDGYVYPHSKTAASLQNALRLAIKNAGIKVNMDTAINKIYKKEADGKDVFVLECDGIDFIADTVIIATGSKASPKTGSDGSGYELVRQLGIDIVKPLPALVQLVCGDKAVCKLGAGVRSYGSIELWVDGQCVANDTGEIQYTDYGISGIPVFQVSRFAVKAIDENREVKAVINMIPDITDSDIEDIFNRRIIAEGYKTLEQFFEGLINKKLVAMIAARCKISESKHIADIDIEKMRHIIETMTHFGFVITGDKGFDYGQVCQGGVALDDIDISNMECKKVKGVFFAGEVVDVDGKCGGYNLQWAWSSAYLAAAGVKERINN